MTSSPTSLDRKKNLGWALLLGLTGVGVVISSSGAHASLESGGPRRSMVAAEKRNPTPMTVAPGVEAAKEPRPFALPFTTSAPRGLLTSSEERAIVARARLEIERVAFYDSTWMTTSSYPMGDIPQNRGACTDVVVRSLREIGIDLQELVHEDIVRDMRAYGVTVLDPHIDHRRLSTMLTFFRRNAMALTTSIKDRSAWRAGDIVFVGWRMRGAPAEHVGVISDRIGPRGLPLVIENAGPKVLEQDSLGRARILGHFRALTKD